MNDELLPSVEVETGAEPVGSVIWLHGLGADGHDFEPIVPMLGIDARRPVRFVFPHAPAIPVTINMGMVMPAWYDILTMDLKRRVDEEGVRRSAARLAALMARENERGIPDERIILAGFSQGGAIAVHQTLRHERRVAGLVALSTYLVCEETLPAELSGKVKGLPVFQGHGSADPMVPFDRGRHLQQRLVEYGLEVDFRSYPMAHQVVMEEIEAIGAFINARMSEAV